MPTPALTLRDAVGQLICPTLYHGLVRGAPYDAIRAAELLDRHQWGGYIVFHDDAAAMRDRLAALRAHARLPLLVAADMEHGAGQQLRGLSVFPNLMAFGATDRPEYAYALGALTAREALDAGVNWILGPVADVTNNALNPIINVRSFGGDPARVAEMVEAFVRGCQDHGALACAKHFPGHGDTETDSHSRLGTVGADRERLEAVEFPPFRAAFAAEVASVMTAHLAVPALDAPDVPATLSRAVMTGLLREGWGYDGLVVTDALGMGGIVRDHDPLEAAVMAIAAGCDMLLMPPDPVATHAAVLEAVEQGRLDEARVRQAAARVLAAKARLGRSAAGTPPMTASELTTRVAGESLTLVPMEPPVTLPERTFVLTVDDGAELDKLAAWREALAASGLAEGASVSLATTESEWQALIERARGFDAVLLGLFSPIRIHKDRSVLAEKMLSPLQALTRQAASVVISFSSPFLAAHFPEAGARVLTYGMHPSQIAAAVAALRQGAPMRGRLPVTLPAALSGTRSGRQEPDDRAPAFA